MPDVRFSQSASSSLAPRPSFRRGLGSLPSWVKANRPDRPRKERKKRTHGFARLREEPTHRVEHATASCPDCQVPLLDGRVCGSRQVITLPRVRARVTEHLVLERACPNAGSGGLPNRIGTTAGRDMTWCRAKREDYDSQRTALVRGCEIQANPSPVTGTSWREDGRNGYLWSFSTPQVRYFLYRPSRGRTVGGGVGG